MFGSSLCRSTRTVPAMPELPEVETVRRGLEPAMVGARFLDVDQRRPDLRFPFPDRFAERLGGRRVDGLGRRAKYLLAALDDANVLVMHLGMSGSFRIDGRAVGRFHHAGGKDAAHDHVVFHFSNGARITYNDPRRFGFMQLVPAGELGFIRCFATSGSSRSATNSTASFCAALRRKVGLPEGRPSRPEPDCRIGQYLRLRGPASRRTVAAAGGRDARTPGRNCDAACASSGRDHSASARGGAGRRRVFATRLPENRRNARLFPAQFPRLRPRARALSDSGLQRSRGAHRPVRPVDVFLQQMPEIKAEASGHGGSPLEQIGMPAGSCEQDSTL